MVKIDKKKKIIFIKKNTPLTSFLSAVSILGKDEIGNYKIRSDKNDNKPFNEGEMVITA